MSRKPGSVESAGATPDLSGGVRERLLSTAQDLFYRRGIRNVGIDEVIAVAGVAKASLYKHFASKDELVAESLRRRDTDWRQWLMSEVDARGASPREKLLAVFDVLGLWLGDETFRGCAFQNAVIEVADSTHPAHQAAAAQKQALRAYVGSLASTSRLRDADAVADQFALLIEGALASAQLNGAARTITTARAAAKTLLEASALP